MPTTKRRRTSSSYRSNPVYRDRLTGGANDVNPQILTVNREIVSAGTWDETVANMPLNPNPPRFGSQAIELLKIYWYLPVLPHTDITTFWLEAQLATQHMTSYTPNHVNVITHFRRDWRSIVANGFSDQETPSIFMHDFTDNAGHGIILCAPKVYLSARNSGNFGAAYFISCRILYRFKNIGMSEYIGVVQNQTAAT